MHPIFTMRIYRYPVPVGKTLLIGYDNERCTDFIGFEEPSDTKFVNLDESLYSEYAENVCRSCDIYFSANNYRAKYNETYQNLFLVHPELCVSFIQDIGIRKILRDFGSWKMRESVYYLYALRQTITPQQFVDGLIKWGNYEGFLQELKNGYSFHQYVSDAIEYVYKTYGKCKDFNLENQCKKKLPVFENKKIECSHNTLYFLQSIDEDRDFFIYDWKTDAPLSLPNIYDDARICWGYGNKKPNSLPEASTQYWSTPFNGDLLLSTSESTSECIEGYGFDCADFYPWDDRYDCVDYDEEPRPFTVEEIIQIVEKGGNNRKKGSMDLSYEEFQIEGVREIVRVVQGRKLSDFDDLIDDEEFLNFLERREDLYLFLINDLGEGLWQAYLPTSENDGIYIEINLHDLENTTWKVSENDNDD